MLSDSVVNPLGWYVPMDRILIGNVRVNALESSSCLGIGPTVIIGVRSFSKDVTANGSIAGDFGAMPCLAGLVYDPDLVDTPIWNFGHREG